MWVASVAVLPLSLARGQAARWTYAHMRTIEYVWAKAKPKGPMARIEASGADKAAGEASWAAGPAWRKDRGGSMPEGRSRALAKPVGQMALDTWMLARRALIRDRRWTLDHGGGR